MAYFLSGDIGGTKTLLQLNSTIESGFPLFQKSYASAAYKGLAEIVGIFLAEADISDIEFACFALAAPINRRKVKITNLPWVVDADELEKLFSIRRVSFINDFEAIGYGINALQPDDLLTLQSGEVREECSYLVVGAGTGLGVAWLSQYDRVIKVHPSEAGHMDFAPVSEIQILLLRYMQDRFDHVSYERLVSGPGMNSIFEFLRDTGLAKPSAQLSEAIVEDDAAAVIARFSLIEEEVIACMAVDLFMSIYGAFVGNMALAVLPQGGIYIAGGIAAKLSKQMQEGNFIN